MIGRYAGTERRDDFIWAEAGPGLKEHRLGLIFPSASCSRELYWRRGGGSSVDLSSMSDTDHQDQQFASVKGIDDAIFAGP